MPLPLAPIAGIAIRYGMVAVTTYAVARSIARTPHDQRAEDALDDLPEGFTAGRGDKQANGTARIKRTFRVGPNGPGIEVDLTALGRFRIRRV